jgi:hypothetical protein
VTSHDTPAPGNAEPAPRACRRPGCGQPLPPHDRGRTRQFCSDECARSYHNQARIPPPRGSTTAGWPGSEDPLAALDTLLRQAAVLLRTAREQAASLDPAAVRAQIAETEAARRRAEAAAVTAAARQAEAEEETQALAAALAAARDDTAAAQAAAQHAADAADAARAALEQHQHQAAAHTAALQDRADQQVSAARKAQQHAETERDNALAAARQARADAAAEITRAGQAEQDARAETGHVRADAERERDALREHCQQQIRAQRDLTDAERARAERAETHLETERADRRALTSHLTSVTENGHPSPARRPQPPASGARTK